LVVYSALITLFGSAFAPEAWIPLLVPLRILVALFVFAPSVRAGRSVLVTATVAVLFVHNLIGGLWIMRSGDTDYNAVKSRWLVTTASSNDIILTADTINFFRYCTTMRTHSGVSLACVDLCRAAEVSLRTRRSLKARSVSCLQKSSCLLPIGSIRNPVVTGDLLSSGR
jgi:hypothetical protein